MSSDTQAGVKVLHWPEEIWCKIFQLLQPCPYDLTEGAKATFKAQAVYAYKQYHDIRLVCSKFNHILACHPRLMTTFIHCQANSSQFMTKMLAYAAANREIHALISSSDMPCLGMLLPQLLAEPSKLNHAVFSAATGATISCLSAFSGIETCMLHHPADGLLNLRPLAALTRLQGLTLEGATFQSVPIHSGLTLLGIFNARVDGLQSSTCPPKLRNLAVVSESSLALPGSGLAFCSCLTRLQLQGGIIQAVHNIWYEHAERPPQSLANLVLLTNLSVNLQDQTVHLDRFGLLPALTRLHLLHRNTSRLTGVAASLGQLTKLKVLLVTPLYVTEHDVLWNCIPVHYVVDWKALKALEHVRITGPACFCESLLQLAELHSFGHLHLASFLPCDEMTSQHVAALKDKLANQQSRVTVVISTSDKFLGGSACVGFDAHLLIVV